MGTYFEDWVLCDCRDRRAEKRSEIHVTSARVETGRQFAPWQQPSRGLHSRIGLEGLTNIQLAEAKGDVADAKVVRLGSTANIQKQKKIYQGLQDDLWRAKKRYLKDAENFEALRVTIHKKVERKVSAKQEQGLYIQLSKSLISQKEKMTSIKDDMSAVKASYLDLLDKAHDTVVVFVDRQNIPAMPSPAHRATQKKLDLQET